MPETKKTFSEIAATQQQPGIVRELFAFAMHNKKWWLVPILVMTLLLAITAYLSSTAAAPFIYSLF